MRNHVVFFHASKTGAETEILNGGIPASLGEFIFKFSKHFQQIADTLLTLGREVEGGGLNLAPIFNQTEPNA